MLVEGPGRRHSGKKPAGFDPEIPGHFAGCSDGLAISATAGGETRGRQYHFDRGLNRLWTDGSLMRPLPVR